MTENTVRLLCFAGVFLALALLELLAPRRELSVGSLALLAEARGWGLLNGLDLPAWLGVLLAVILLDFVIYLQHVLFHALPFLWRLHRVHHADLDVDVTTGVRFHPLEIVISL